MKDAGKKSRRPSAGRFPSCCSALWQLSDGNLKRFIAVRDTEKFSDEEK